MNKEEASSAPTEFGSAETHGILHLPSSRKLAASDGLGWTSLHLSALVETPYENAFTARPDTLISIYLTGPVSVVRGTRRERVRRQMLPGSIGVVPEGMDFEIALEGEVTTFHLYVRKAVIEEVAADFFHGDPSTLQIIPRFGVSDSVINQLGFEARKALDDPPYAAVMYADYLARALATRLLINHSNVSARSLNQLPASGLHASLLNRAKDFIDAHLHEHLYLKDLAAGSGLSAGHFARQFKRSIGCSPHQYILRARVNRAKSLLAGDDTAIAEIALACGFADQEHLTKVFKRVTGATPAAYRNARRG